MDVNIVLERSFIYKHFSAAIENMFACALIILLFFLNDAMQIEKLILTSTNVHNMHIRVSEIVTDTYHE